MLTIETRIRFLFDEKIVGVIRTRTASDALNVVRALVAGGFKAVEVPMTVPDAVNVLKELVQTVGDGVMVGAGTVMTAADARACIEAGCQFIVAPSAGSRYRPCRGPAWSPFPARRRRPRSRPAGGQARTSSGLSGSHPRR
jgi:2-keto-3-deoxy-6-phosphogluconate aldolase